MGDVKTELEDRLGKEDLFRLIYCGRLLKDDDPVRKYEIDEKRWVVVMITRGKTEDTSTSVRKDESLEEETRRVAGLERVDKKEAEVGTGLSNQDVLLSRDVDVEEEEEEEIPDIDVSAYLPQDALITNINQTEKEEQRGNVDEKENQDYLAATSVETQPVQTICDEVEEAEKMEALNLRLQQLRESLARQREAEERESSEEEEESEDDGESSNN